MISVLPGGPRALPEDVSEMIVYSLAANGGPFALLLFRGTHRSWRLVLQQALHNEKNLLDLAVPSIHELANVSDSSDLPLDSSLLRRIGLRVCDNRNDSAVNRYCIYDRQIDLTNIDQCRQYFRQWHLGSGVEVVSDNVQRVDVYGRVLPNGFVWQLPNYTLPGGGQVYDPHSTCKAVEYAEMIHGMRAVWKHVLFQLHRIALLIKMRLVPLLKQALSVDSTRQLLLFLYASLDRDATVSCFINKVGIMNLLDAYSTLRVGFAFESIVLCRSKTAEEIMRDVDKNFADFEPWKSLRDVVVASCDQRLSWFGLFNFAHIVSMFYVESPGACILILGDSQRLRICFPPFVDQGRSPHGNLEVCFNLPVSTLTVHATPIWKRGSKTAMVHGDFFNWKPIIRMTIVRDA